MKAEKPDSNLGFEKEARWKRFSSSLERKVYFSASPPSTLPLAIGMHWMCVPGWSEQEERKEGLFHFLSAFKQTQFSFLLSSHPALNPGEPLPPKKSLYFSTLFSSCIGLLTYTRNDGRKKETTKAGIFCLRLKKVNWQKSFLHSRVFRLKIKMTERIELKLGGFMSRGKSSIIWQFHE